MGWQDGINGAFELFGGAFILLSVFKLRREKVVRGISWLHMAYFMTWGWWNLYYYPHLGQWLSFVGGVFIVITNTLYLGQLLYYGSKKRLMTGC